MSLSYGRFKGQLRCMVTLNLNGDKYYIEATYSPASSHNYRQLIDSWTLYSHPAALFAMLGNPSERFLRANPDVQFAPPPQASVDGWSPNFFIHTSLEEWPWRDGTLAFRLARLWSIIISTVTVAAFYGLARTVLPPDRPWLLIGA